MTEDGSEGEMQMAFNYQKHGKDLTKIKALGDADKLFNSMGNKEYQSSLKADISVSLRKSPAATAENTIVPDVDIEPTLRHVPSKSIGAKKEDDGRREFNNTTICSFIVPVSTQTVAMKQADIVQQWFIDEIKGVFPVISLSGKDISWDTYDSYRQSITNYNQNVASQVGGQLDQRNVTGQVRKKLRAMLMQKGRKVLTTYSVDITVNITHSIYNSYIQKNFKDSIENVDYYESRTKLYSRNITKRMSIPVSNMNELRRVFEVIKDLNPNFKELEVIDKQKVVELSQTPADESFIKSDEELAHELGFNSNTEILEDESFDSINNLMSLFHSSGDTLIIENPDAKKPDSIS